MSKSFLFDTTNLALEILLAATKKTLDNKVLTEDESKVVGKALGWLALMTVNTKNDIFAEYNVALKEVNAAMRKNINTAMISNVKINSMPMGKAIAAHGGTYRKRKIGGAIPLIAYIMGALTVLWSGNTGYTLYQLNEHRAQIRAGGIELINSACPASLSLGAPARPVFTGYLSAEYQRQLTQFEQDTITCNTARATVGVRVRDAETRFTTAMDNIPTQIGLLTMTGVVAATGPVGIPATAAALAQGTALGGAVQQVTTSILTGALPRNQSQVAALATSIVTAFPGAPPAQPPPGGGGKRRSTRRSRKGSKLTRRR